MIPTAQFPLIGLDRLFYYISKESSAISSSPKEVLFLSQFYLVWINYILFQTTGILLTTVANSIALTSKILSIQLTWHFIWSSHKKLKCSIVLIYYIFTLPFIQQIIGAPNDTCDFPKHQTAAWNSGLHAVPGPPTSFPDDRLMRLLSLLTSSFLKSYTEYFIVWSFTSMTARRRLQEYCDMLSNQ